MKKRRPERPQPAPELESAIEQQESEVGTFTEIGGSPVPGLTLRHVLRGHRNAINRIAWSPDGSYLASPSDDRTIRIWEARSGACMRILRGHNGPVHHVAWSPDGHFIASGSTDNTIKIWESSSGRIVRTLTGHNEWINSVVYSLDGKRLVSTSGDKTLRIWETATGNVQLMFRFPAITAESTWTKDGRKLLMVGIEGFRGKDAQNFIQVLDGVTWESKTVLAFGEKQPNAYAFYEDNSAQVPSDLWMTSNVRWPQANSEQARWETLPSF
jgi:WD40 repeat protein